MLSLVITSGISKVRLQRTRAAHEGLKGRFKKVF
jgi:hypothetical protein